MLTVRPRKLLSPSTWATRSRISAAALLVKVTASTLYGRTPWARSAAIRRVMTLVLPDPGPASTSAGPPRCRTARCWLGVKLASSSAGISGRRNTAGTWASEANGSSVCPTLGGMTAG